MSFDRDVAIVGGGPAGTSTAIHLVRAEGIRADRVVVLDKARFPRDKPCAGAISQLGVDALRDVGVSVRVPAVAMQGVRVILGGEIGETRCAMGIVVRRIELDAQLVDEARAVGVEVREGAGVTAIERVPGGFRVTTAEGAITARFLAAADGAGSTTRKLLGMRETERKGHLYVLETEPSAADTGTTRGLIDFDLSVLEDGLQGYYWDFPVIVGGAPGVSRGIYHANLSPSSDVKKALGRALRRRGVDIEKVKLKPFSTRPYVPGSRVAEPGVVLVGEAAGIDRTTGEGIAQAIVMGKIAARHLMRALRTGGSCFERYARDVRASTIGRHMLQSAWLARRVYRRSGLPARRLLLRSDFARDAAMRWYHGASLPWSTQARLALGLAASAIG
ncbi:MAG: NAD(P)/FAD-dependent oxidoreductase [Labilithrix sp.]|nr:NAD(P)/FAD-dependent oxidoreductase [Labilithrix sp.]